ncbi:MAG: DegT/DnrJ/EryC1/StrS aminotransferase family protein [Acidobacteriota bacterium]
MPILNIPRFRPTTSLREAAAFLRSIVPGGGDPGERFAAGLSQGALAGHPVILAPSARIALYWLLKSLGIGPGDQVILQAFNFPAVPAAVRATGAEVLFLDVAAGTFEADWSALESVIGDRTKAVIATHLYGNPVDLAGVKEICDRRGIFLIEDCAQAIGATAGKRKVGTVGDGSFFSLGPTKNLTLLGGGAVSAADPDRAVRIREMASAHRSSGVGTSLKLAAKATAMGVATHPLVFSSVVLPILKFFERRGTDLVHEVMQEPTGPLTGIEGARLPSRQMAAVGVAQLTRMAGMNRARIRNGWYLRSRLEGLPALVVPPMRTGSVFMSFPVLHPRREALALQLRRLGIDTDFGFMADCSTIETGDSTGRPCPNADRTSREILHLPVHPFLKKRQMDRIANAVRDAFQALS